MSMKARNDQVHLEFDVSNRSIEPKDDPSHEVLFYMMFLVTRDVGSRIIKPEMLTAG